MPDICPKCGLLKEICACDILEKESVRKIRVYATKKRFRKLVTVVEGLEADKLDDCAHDLKTRLACGGTSKDGIIVLQGNHLSKMKKLLMEQSYPEESIVIVPGIN